MKCFCNLSFYRIGIIILIIIPILKVESQSSYFTKIIPFERDEDIAWSVTTAKDGYIYCTGSYCFNEDIQCIKLGKIDLLGNTLWNKKFVRFPRFQGNAVTNSETAIYLSGNNLYLRPDSSFHNIIPFVMKLNQNGDSLWMIEYGESNDPNTGVQNVSLQLKYYKDNVYLLDGVWNNDIPRSTYLRLTKLDTSGKVIWKTKLNTHVAPGSFQPVSRYFQFDDIGNILICVAVDTNASQGDAIPYQGIINTDGIILKEGRLYPLELNVINFTYYPIKGAFTKQQSSVWISHHDYFAGHDELLVYSFDSNHHKTWRTIVEAHSEAVYNPKLFGWSNGDMIGLYETSERKLFSHNGGSGVLRISQDGNLKWKRRYYMEPWIPNSLIQVNFSWMDETEDGGIILSGSYEFYNQWKVLEYDVILAKLDSMGCSYKDCNLEDTIIILKESITQVKNETLKELYSWSITNDHSELRVEFDQNIKKPDLIIIVSDIYGKEVNRQIVKSFQSSAYFDLSNLNQGLYCLSMNAGKVIKGFKFIK